ncbi:MAG: glycosyltransferase family 2 protein [Treponema sp.]|nr:glycosyltransferase family 2 protein [Treponema sp.]
MKPIISLIIPCFNEEESLLPLYKEICSVSASMEEKYGVDFEFLLVNDGSTDKTLEILRELSCKDDRLHYISLSRNFGKESCIFAGFENCAGDYIAVLDADLQHPPSMLAQMYEGIANEGYDCVSARRSSRAGEPIIRSFFARSFYRMINKISRTKMVNGATDFSMMTRQVVDAILTMPEYNRFSKGIYSWVGFNTKWLHYKNVERAHGSTKWSFSKLFIYSLEGIISFSTAPLIIASVLGILFFLISLIIIIYIVIETFFYGTPGSGYATIVCAIFFIGGIQLFCTGILGQYLAKTYLEVKRRPIYLIKESKLSEKQKS